MSGFVRIGEMVEGDIAAVVAMDPAAGVRQEHLRAEFLRPWSLRWVARDGSGDPVAYVTAWHVIDEVAVMNLATRSDRRRQGIARALMGAVVEYARGHRVRRVLLEARRSNAPAIALYRGIGFFAAGVRPRYYGDDEDAVEMALVLDSATGQVVRRADEVAIDA